MAIGSKRYHGLANFGAASTSVTALDTAFAYLHSIMVYKFDSVVHKQALQCIWAGAATIHDDLKLLEECDALVCFCKKLQRVWGTVEHLELVLGPPLPRVRDSTKTDWMTRSWYSLELDEKSLSLTTPHRTCLMLRPKIVTSLPPTVMKAR